MRPGIILAVLALTAIGISVFSIGTALAKDNPVVVGPSFFCDASKSGQVCETAVTAGDTVTWTVQSGSHTVTQCTDGTFTSCGSGFTSGSLNPGATYVQTFASAGTTFYRCQFHPSEMMGRIVAAQAATPSPTVAPTSATASPTIAPSLPSTGDTPGDGGIELWTYALMAIGGIMAIGGGVSVAVARRRID